MRAAIVLLLLLAGARPAWAQPDRVDAFITQRMNAAGVPGMSVAVIKDGAVIKSAGYGVADVARRIPATPSTVYKIGSVSKQFIAAAIVLLEQDGRLRFDDPIGQYLEGTPPAWRPITIRHLLTHTSGLVRESPGFEPQKIQPDTDVLRAAHALPLRFQPGEKWEYSNVGYFALADIIRSITGAPWPEFLRQRIFTPAAMSVTTVTNDSRATERAIGHTGNDNQRTADDWPALRPSGALLSTVLDLAKWDAAFSRNGLLTRASRERMTTPMRLNNGNETTYGFGLHVDKFNDQRRVWHGGGLPGFISHFARFPDAGLTIILLANGDDVDLPSIAMGVASLYLDPASGVAGGAQKLDAASIANAVKATAAVFAAEYFDIPLSKTVAAEINARSAAGRYDSARTAADLATSLTADFFALTNDKHVVVAVARRHDGSAGGGQERRNVPTTAGFRRSEIVAGNVGVLDLAFFMRPVEHRDALADAMRRLQPADALIIDMRENGGGSPGTVALLVSYLLERPERPLFEIAQRNGTRETFHTEAVAVRNATRPVYVLTSRRSFSGGEGLAFLLQDLKRATVVGEVTAGAANPGRPYPAGDLLEVTVPNGQLLTSITRRNWEGAGVSPDIATPAHDAMRVAHLHAIDRLLTTADTPARRQELQRVRATLVQP